MIPYPGAPPTPPYDNAGWTLAFQMGVAFDRMLEPFTGPFEQVTDWNVAPPAGRVHDSDRRRGVSARPPGQRCLSRGESTARAGRARQRVAGCVLRRGRRTASVAQLQKVAADLGVSAQGVAGAAPAATTAARATHRAVGSVRRVDGVWMDAMDPRTVRVPVRSRVRTAARRRRAERDVRRAGVPERRHSRRRRAAGVAGAAGDAAAAPGAERRPAGISARRSAASVAETHRFRSCGSSSRPAARSSRSAIRRRISPTLEASHRGIT